MLVISSLHPFAWLLWVTTVSAGCFHFGWLADEKKKEDWPKTAPPFTATSIQLMFWNQWNTDFYHPNNSRQLPLVWTNDWRPNLIRALWVAVECIRNEWQSVETHRSIFRTHSIITSCAISATHPEFDDTHLHSSEIEAHSLNCGRHGCQSIDLYVCHLQSCMSTSSGVRVSVTVRHIKMQRTYYLDQIVFTISTIVRWSCLCFTK